MSPIVLGVRYDDLPAQGRANKARELVDLLERQGHFSNLIEMGKRIFPGIPWEVQPTPSEAIAATVEPSPPTTFPVIDLYLARTPPPDVAILHVYAHGTEEYMIWGGHVDLRLPHTGPQGCPQLSLGEMVQPYVQEGIEYPHRIKEYLTEFSRVQGPLRRWLNGLRQKYGEQLNLLIIDHTDLEIPWEMVKLSQHGDYLGAVVTTARWQRVESWEMGTLSMNFEFEECQGHVVSYIDQVELQGVGPEREALNQLNALCEVNLHEFCGRMEQAQAGVGLVYLATHGIWGHYLDEVAIGSLKHVEHRLRLFELYDRELVLFQHSHSVVFINACHSGRLRTEERRLRDGMRRGFAELFLSQGARGVIGPLAGVNDEKAAHFAHHFILAVQQYPELSVAAILRLLRARAITGLPTTPTDQDLLDFVYTFMYVYYGNPHTKLRLIKREG